ncbi:MAG: glycosyltransferase [Planctomycetes bacterium]|nr:glycosyltransferase [Planctomycetota bacterium]
MARRVRIMQVGYSFEIGGSEKLAATISAHLDQRRFAPSLCALTMDGPLSSDLRSRGIACHVMGRRRGLDAALVMRLCRLFRRERVDIVQTHHAGQLLYALPAARLARVRAVVHTEHEQFSLQSNPRLRLTLRVLARLVSRIVCVGDDVAAYLADTMGLSHEKVQVIRNGIDTTAFAVTSDAARHKDRLGCAASDFVFGNVSRLNPVKDHASLIRAFSRLTRNAAGPAKLALIGDGELRQELKALVSSLGIAEFVRFLGARTDVPSLLPGFDAFVLSSYNEGLPLALLEAMSCARPVVATSVGSIPSVITHRVNGLLVPPKDTNALAAAMSELLADAALCKRLGREARNTVERTFSLDAMMRRYEAVYDAALANGRHGSAE